MSVTLSYSHLRTRAVVDDSGQVLGNVSKVLDKPEALHFAVVMVKGKQFKVHYTDCSCTMCPSPHNNNTHPVLHLFYR